MQVYNGIQEVSEVVTSGVPCIREWGSGLQLDLHLIGGEAAQAGLELAARFGIRGHGHDGHLIRRDRDLGLFRPRQRLDPEVERLVPRLRRGIARGLQKVGDRRVERVPGDPLEEGEGYKRLIDEFNHTQDALSRAVGKSRSHIANNLRLLNLPASIKTMLIGGELSAGHARALLNLDNPNNLARRIIKQGLNVRQTERLVQQAKTASGTKKSGTTKDPDTMALEKDLSDHLGLRVVVNFRGDDGELVIHYKTVEQLDDVLQKLGYGKAPTLN